MTDTTSKSVPTVWLVGLGLASMLVPINSTMIAVALPDIADDFAIAKGATGLLVTVYLVVMLVGQPVAGRLADRFGSRRMILGALVGFAVCSVAASFATSFLLLVVGRVAQALFGAVLMPVSRGLIRLVTPVNERGRNFGFQEALFGLGAATGPLIGGLVIGVGGWPAVFLVNVPIAACALILIRRISADETTNERGGTERSTIGVVLRERSFVVPFITHAAAVLAQYSLLLTVPIVLDGRGWSSTEVGSALILLTVGMVVAGPVGGRIGDVQGRRRPVVTGIMVGVVGVGMAAAAIESNPQIVLAAMAIFGVGFGLAVPNLTTSALDSVPTHLVGSASGAWSMSRYVGSIPASVVFASMIGDGTSGAQALLILATAAMILAVVASSQIKQVAAA